VILNPFLHLVPFKQDARLISNGTIHGLLSRLCSCFYKQPAPPELYEEIANYLSWGDIYQDLRSTCNSIKAAAAKNVSVQIHHLDTQAELCN